MKIAKVLIIILAAILIFQVIYYLYQQYSNHQTIKSVLENNNSGNINIEVEKVEPSPPEGNFLITGFESPEDTSGIFMYQCTIKRDKEYVASGLYSLKMEYNKARYPSITINYIHRKWSWYDSLKISVYNTSHDKRAFLMRIDDHESYWNRETYFGQVDSLTPGWNHLSYHMTNIGSKVDLDHIFRIVLALEKPPESGVIYIDDIILHYKAVP